MEDKRFEVIYLQEAVTFLQSLQGQARKKVIYNVDKIASGIKDSELFKKLEGTDIWEFRTLYNGIQYRLFAFWDREEETMVIATHGIVKKTWKVPSKEIAKAERIKEEYLRNKTK